MCRIKEEIDFKVVVGIFLVIYFMERDEFVIEEFLDGGRILF